MNIKLHLSTIYVFTSLITIAQFPSTASVWNLPNIESALADMNTVFSSNYSLYDINGDGFPDLIDPKDNFSGSVWENGAQRYWKVYLNNGSAISTSATDWNVPNVESTAMDMNSIGNGFYGLYDINGDGKPDLVDSRDNFGGSVWLNSAQRYWKVYLNNGTSFSTTANQWNLPNVESNEMDMNVILSAFYGLYDMNGDGKLDLVDSRDNFSNSVWLNGAQRFWKVYLNNGSAFSTSETQWNLPNVESSEMDMNVVGNGNFALIDMNGDAKLDLVDAEDNFTNEVWINGAQRYWKVYTNNGTAFSVAPINWNIPNVESAAADMSSIFTAFYGLFDINGDGYPDLVDTKDNFSGSVWLNGAQRFWKVYLNQGSSFNTSEIQWNIPNVESAEMDMNVIGNSFFAPVDMNGDGLLDLVDARDNFSGNVWENGAQRYWKVYANINVGMRTSSEELTLALFPNPSTGTIGINLTDLPSAKISVYNSIGLLVFEKSDLESKIQFLDLSEVPPGTYSIQIESAQQFYTGKLIKE
jgi:hypothetical protein